jgi:ubiquitin
METIIPKEEISIPNYNDYKQAAQQKIQKEQMQTLENVLCYTNKELALYVEESEMQKLYTYIRTFQYATEKECNKINSPVTVNSKLKPIDLMHFGWNIGNQFNKSGIEIATFIKRVFAEVLK